ncbi:MAG: hypothetical protein II631_08675, partial [Treponema sp.]|nr:hypothetical protein [Treponema sp.]
MQNTRVKTSTDKEKYVTDKNGNIKYDFKVDKEGNLTVEPRKKKGTEKVETTAGANIIDYYAGGFEGGKLKSQAGSEKVANQRAGWLRDSKFMAGAMQGAGYSDIKQGIGKYGKAASKDVERSTSSGAFNAGYMAGFMGQFGMLGAGKIPETLVRGVGKKGLQRGALNIGARKGAVSMAAELPVNTVDALKMATDADGNVDKKSLAGWLALNTALSGGATGIMGAGGAKMTKSQAREYLNLNAKAQSGVMLTEDELSKLSSIEKKLQNKGYNIANSDIANKAQYDAEVGWKVFENGGTAKEAAEAMNGAATNVTKLNYASSIKAEADTQFEALRVARQNLLKELDNATPEQKVAIREQAAVWKKEIDRLGEISNVADRELNLAKEANKKGVRDLTKSLDNMSQKTGTEYHALNDVEMRNRITKVMNEKADRLEAGLAKLSPEDQARVSERIKQLRKGASEDEFYSGFYYKDADGKTKVLINTDSPQAHQTIVGHETGHIIKANNAHEFEQLGTMLEQYAKKAGDYDAVYNQIKNSYPEATEPDLREEVTCELLGRYVYGNDDTFIKQIAGENPTLVQRIIDYIKELFDKTTDREMKAELKAIRDKAQKAVDS